MALHLNGPKSFVHPVSGLIVSPFQWYEGFGHTEYEKENQPEPEIVEEAPKKKRKNKKDGAVDLEKSDDEAPEDSESEMGE